MGSQQPVSQLQATKAFGGILSTIQISLSSSTFFFNSVLQSRWIIAMKIKILFSIKTKLNAMCMAGIKHARIGVSGQFLAERKNYKKPAFIRQNLFLSVEPFIRQNLFLSVEPFIRKI